MLEVGVCGHKNGESFPLGHIEQLAVPECRPPSFKYRRHIVPGQSMPQRFWCPLIEQDTHSGRREGALTGMVEDGSDLIESDTGKPFHELRCGRAVFEVLKKSRDRNASLTENPHAADTIRVLFYSWTRRPIDHGLIVASECHQEMDSVR